LTTEQYWKTLDALASSRDADRLLSAVELLRANPALPLLIACRRSTGHIHHLYTVFDERNPHAVGNRYLICFTSTKQAGKAAQTVPEAAEHSPSPDFENLEDRYPSGQQRRKKQQFQVWKTESGEVAQVPTGKVLAYMHRSPTIGGLVFNPADEKRSLALAKFLLN